VDDGATISGFLVLRATVHGGRQAGEALMSELRVALSGSLSCERCCCRAGGAEAAELGAGRFSKWEPPGRAMVKARIGGHVPGATGGWREPRVHVGVACYGQI